MTIWALVPAGLIVVALSAGFWSSVTKKPKPRMRRFEGVPDHHRMIERNGFKTRMGSR
jgi:hypothetical protein